jgi:hypothetical protein
MDPTAPRKKYALLKWVRHYNKRNHAHIIAIPDGFRPKVQRIGEPARILLRRMQHAAGIPESGHFDERTMRRLLPPGTRSKVMGKAHSQLGVHEWPAGSNSGPVRKYLEAAGYPWAGPWCAAFVTWVLLKVGFKRSCLPPAPASVASWLEHAREHHCLKPVEDALRGDLWIWGFGGNPHAHIGFCDDRDPDDQVAYGLDGNVGDYGGSVTHVTRSSGQITACIDLIKLKRIAA